MRSPAVVAALCVGLLTACGGAGSTSAAPAAVSSSTTAAAVSSSDPAAGDAGPGAKYAKIVCTALKDTLAGLKSQNAVAAGYQAQMVLAMASTTIPPAELKSSMDDAAVSAACPDDYKDFLEKAGITSLSSL